MSILRGDCIEVMRTLEADSIDAIVTDPPYGLEFMGKEWDSFRTDDPGTSRFRGDRAGSYGEAGEGDRDGHPARNGIAVAYGGGTRAKTSRCVGCGKRDQFRNAHACPPGTRWATELVDPFAAPPSSLAFQNWTREWAREALRVLRPGGHILAFGGTRMYHRLAAGIEDAGFEIRDQLMWIYASGFPKSLDVSKAIDKATGAERKTIRVKARPETCGTMAGSGDTRPWIEKSREVGYHEVAGNEPATDAAREWQGWGTALKPAHEPIVLARKPLVGTVAANVQAHGTGALNIDGCRIGTDSVTTNHTSRPAGDALVGRGAKATGVASIHIGRWPANVVLTDSVFDGGWEGVVGGGEASYNPRGVFGKQRGDQSSDTSAPFAVRKDGDGIFGYGDTGTYSRFFLVPKAPRRERVLRDGRRSPHPTQKPEQLIRHLVTMVTPPGGIVLDPFLGSGTLGVVCEDIGVRWLGIEREAEYADWARDRLADRQPEWVKAEEEMC